MVPTVTTDDGVRLHYEQAGEGTPLVFIHEFAGDLRSWEPQLRHFARSYRCVAYNARGYPPSDVPQGAERYSQQRARDDILSVMDELGLDRAHLVGLSMGGFATLHFGLAYPDRALSLTIAGCGYGAEPRQRERFQRETAAIARRLREEGMAPFARRYALGPTRVQFQNKDPRGWSEFAAQLATHSAVGSALTEEGVMKNRPSLYDLETEMRMLEVPTLIITGDEDWPCLAPNLLMKHAIPSAGLLVLPCTGHTINLEEPAAFNQHLERFLARVDAGRWLPRDPRAVADSITGID
jgi:pimeloyl-ACP methyl ester carboxylesterase